MKQKSEQSDRVAINSTDCSKFSVQKGKEWDIEEVIIDYHTFVVEKITKKN